MNRIIIFSNPGKINYVFSGNRAIYYAMLGEIDLSFQHLQSAVEGGWVIVGDPVEVEPALAALVDDPRFAEIKATMLAKVNGYRELLELAPFDENYQVQVQL